MIESQSTTWICKKRCKEQEDIQSKRFEAEKLLYGMKLLVKDTVNKIIYGDLDCTGFRFFVGFAKNFKCKQINAKFRWM